MKRLGQTWEAITDFGNLYAAYRLARRGKSNREEVARFTLQLEQQLHRLQWELQSFNYQPGNYRLFTLYERKPRQIAAAPFKDRVVHHALMRIIEPELDRRFIHDSYACRKGKGVHAAVDRYQHWSQRYPYVLQLDIQRYFPSIHRPTLKQRLRRYLKEPHTLHLLDTIIDHSPEDARSDSDCGIPIGNLTSQFFANLYLNRLDHFIKQQLHCRAYLRYVDDLVLLADSKHQLWHWYQVISDTLQQERLQLHSQPTLSKVTDGIDLFGYRIWPTKRQLRNDNGHRFARQHRQRARAFAAGQLELTQMRPAVQSWIGHARHGDTEGLRRKLLGGIVFSRGS
ncbi:RNA-dependent DNA polymerase [Ectothiorhodospiraceae bacterium BW-2]|nr:RNA-dependent DNA polymerase [Ectothiorhodospiraceae bacterium BW-2]